MASSIRNNSYPKAKLPRKRKKAAIKAQGRSWYHGTIKLYNVCAEKGQAEPVCKFWDNSSLKPKAIMVQGAPRVIMMATKFW